MQIINKGTIPPTWFCYSSLELGSIIDNRFDSFDFFDILNKWYIELPFPLKDYIPIQESILPYIILL